MLVHIKKIIPPASRGRYAVGAFNVLNLETAKAVLLAADRLRAPVILQVTSKTLVYAGFEPIATLIAALANEFPRAKAALHLDHGKDDTIARRCIQSGFFSSVMRDASTLPLEENVQKVSSIVRLARTKGVWVQGELGTLFGKEGLLKFEKGFLPKEFMTDPDEALEFVKRTGVDTLAVSVGTIHGAFKGKEKIDFERLHAIRKKVDVPLVLHGGSGVSSRDMRRAVTEGIRIVNIDTELRIAFVETLQKTLRTNVSLIDPRELFAPAIQAVANVVESKIKILGSEGKA
jgi:ketose-bisphosphate aldolase